MTKEERKDMRKNLGRVSRFALFYTLVFMAGTFISLAGVTVVKVIEAPEMGLKELENYVFSFAGEYSLVSIVVGAVFVLLVRRKKLFTEDLVHSPEKPMTGRIFMTAVALLFSLQAIASYVIAPLIRWGAGALGYSVYGTIDSLNDAPVTFAMVLYTGILGPVMEEVVFRGVVMRGFAQYGKVFAIVTSAFLFGIFHSDLSQGLFAFGAGLLFGYIAIEFGIHWAIVLHIFNNLVMSDILGRMLALAPETLQAGLIPSIGALGIVLLIKKRAAIAETLHSETVGNGAALALWTTPSFLIFVVLEAGMMTTAFTPVG